MLSVNADFNGDGFDDLAIGVEGEQIDGLGSAGGVNVLYGSASGLRALDNQLWTLNSPGINGVAHAADRFGSALAVGDFDGDGFDDLAVGTPMYRVSSKNAAGVVNLIYGSSNGLQATGDQQFSQDTPGVNGVAAAADLFGVALAAGDFDGDGIDDLAIGASGDNVGSKGKAGAVNVLYGQQNTGLSASNDQLWNQDSSGINGVAQAGELFGSVLATGDFDDNGRDDLAIGLPGETVSGQFQAGAVNVIYGASSRLHQSGDQLWHHNAAGLIGAAQAMSHFGRSLTTGDFDGDDFSDLAIGAPDAKVDMVPSVGSVNVLYGSTGRLSTEDNQFFVFPGPGPGESGHRFGAALAAGDSRGSGHDELAISIPGFAIGSATNCGNVFILRSSSNGLTYTNAYFRNQNTTGVPDVAEAGDVFGRSLAFGDYDNDGFYDLAVGVPAEDIDFGNTAVFNAGAINVLYGVSTGISGSGAQFFNQVSLGVLGDPQASDEFGGALA